MLRSLMLALALLTLGLCQAAPRLVLHFDVNKTLIDGESDPNGDVFPSFYKLLHTLDEMGIEYSVLLRSFGPQGSRVAAAIEERLGSSFFAGRGFFDAGTLILEGIGELDCEESYRYLTSGQNWFIQDDFGWWFLHGEEPGYGKPLYIQDGESILQIFFDDRASGIHARKDIIAPIDPETGQARCSAELIGLGQIVRVETAEAMAHENYFVEKVLEALLKRETRDRVAAPLRGVGEYGGWRQAHLNGGADLSLLQNTV